MVTGATRLVLQPRKALSPMVVRNFSLPLKLAMATPQPKFTPLPQSVSPT